MKIRTITTGIQLSSFHDFDKIRAAAEFNKEAKAYYTEAGYEVQTTRVTTNSWEEYSLGMSKVDIISAIEEIDRTCQSLHVDFFNIGHTSNPDTTVIIPEFNKTTTAISCSAKIGDMTKGINYKNAKSAAEVIKRISEETENGTSPRATVWSC